jgi:hypothetical protein
LADSLRTAAEFKDIMEGLRSQVEAVRQERQVQARLIYSFIGCYSGANAERDEVSFEDPLATKHCSSVQGSQSGLVRVIEAGEHQIQMVRVKHP